MFKWKLTRPLAIFDIEATGLNTRTDRIVQLCVIKIMPDQSRITYETLVNPQRPIPQETTEIHGIKDADVAGCKTFPELATDLDVFLHDCDLGGFNIARFDVPMLTEEFFKAGIKFDIDQRNIVDAQRIYHKKVPRDLEAALAYYCGEMHIDAHDAKADVLATIRVLESQIAKYSDLKDMSMSELSDFCTMRKTDWVDRTGKFKWEKGEVVINFGKKQGVLLRDLINNEKSFIKWMLNSDFPRDTKEILENAMDGKWPNPPKQAVQLSD
jgi:DNA polymerase III subunit epsilon